MRFTRSSALYNQLYYRYNTVRHKNVSILKKIKILLRKRFVNTDSVWDNVNISDEQKSSNFFYWIDENVVPVSNKIIYDNLTPDYKIILENSLSNILRNGDKISEKIRFYLEKIKVKLPGYIESINKIESGPCTSFKDALQRILFVNQLVWQEGHKLVGLGHLDWILADYYETDKKCGVLDKETALELIKDFLKLLHGHYEYKSSSLLGDTGQIIILGGLDVDGNYKSNELTKIFIQAVKDLHLPDPKVLLRVSKDIPDDLLNDSIDCIATGIGCPLFANDDVIIPILESFGYPKDDSYNYGTSACWEPFITGKSVDANNIFQLNLLEPLVRLIDDKKLSGVKDFNSLLENYKKKLEFYIKESLKIVCKFKWEKYPVLSLFIQKNSESKPFYSDIGFTTVALSNTVNSLLNIKKYVYDNKVFSLDDISNFIKSDFKGNDKVRNLLKENAVYFGSDDDENIKLTNDIFVSLSNFISSCNTRLDKKIKIGASSPSYISLAKSFPGSPDGRKKGEAFNVHISNENSKDYSSLFSFAASLDYQDNRFNGNVIDFMVSPRFIKNNFNKFRDMLRVSFLQGIFEMQINVLDSKTLIAAKESPELFPNLIVRVWGFSAYFNDLPESYKNVLIHRALESERSYN